VELIYFTGKSRKGSNTLEIEILCAYGSYGALRVIATYHSRAIERSEDNNIWLRHPVIQGGMMQAHWETNQNDDGSYYIIQPSEKTPN